MRTRLFSGRIATVGIVLALGTTVVAGQAVARSKSSSAHGYAHASHTASVYSSHTSYAGHGYSHADRYSVRSHLFARLFQGGGGGRLQCVPFARENTGIEISGNANTWWDNADGVYQRGAKPEVGSVLNFRANGRMHMGHVAVVSNVIDGRNIEIDHANWSGPGASRGGISRNITVIDVSPENDWTAVRVALGQSSEFGSVYPTFGFIYDRPDSGRMVANNTPAPAPLLNAAPRDLRPASERMEVATALQDNEEVAEAEDDTQPRTFRRAGRHARFTSARFMTHGFSRYYARSMSRSMEPVTMTRVRSHGATLGHTHHVGRRRT